VSPKDNVLDGGPMRRGKFVGNGAVQCNVFRECSISCAKTAELIELPLGMMSRVGTWTWQMTARGLWSYGCIKRERGTQPVSKLLWTMLLYIATKQTEVHTKGISYINQ